MLNSPGPKLRDDAETDEALPVCSELVDVSVHYTGCPSLQLGDEPPFEVEARALLFQEKLIDGDGPPVFILSVGGVSMTVEGLLAGAVQIYRLCLLVTVAALLTFTTSPVQLTHGLESVLGPLARLGLPVRELAMVLTIALRFVPALFEEIDKITKAQRARGAEIGSGWPWQRIRSLVPVFVPIFVSAFRRAEELATAMEARGFRTAHPRTRLYRLRLTRRDLAASIVVLAVSLAALGLERLHLSYEVLDLLRW